MTKIDFVTVVNDSEQYEKYFVKNNNVNKNNLVKYNNSTDNISITKRFNDYINNRMQDDTWVIFCHQDFEFREDINNILYSLDKNCIYGPVGASTKKNFIFFIRFNGIKIAKCKVGFVDKTVIKGQIVEIGKSKEIIAGRPAKDYEIVDTLDCCCFIIHSSLINKLNLRFDENLDWHLYSEDLSLFAKTKYNIYTRIINFKAAHHSSGDYNPNFFMSLEYLKQKYKNYPLISTVYDGAYMKFLEKL